MNAIVYTSNTGFTKKYADMLGKKTGLPVYDLENAQPAEGKDIVYLGWLSAGTIKGYKKALKRFNIKAVCAVGISSYSDSYYQELKKRNSIEAPFFYMMGGYDYNRLKGFSKFLMKIFSAMIIKQTEKKPDKTPEDIISIEVMKNGGDYVKEENLLPVVDLIKSGK